MTDIKFNKIQIDNYFAQNNIQLNEQDKAKINSIFDECDVENEKGEQGPDGILSRDEVRSFMNKITTIKHLAQNFFNFINDIAENTTELQNIQQNREIKEAECILSEKEQAVYKQNLQTAKDICNKNQESLGLTDAELAFINNSDVVSESYGAARFDRNSNKLLFNLNNNGNTSVSSLLKILIHEATHATLNSTHNSKAEERQCETRALSIASKLYKDGKIDDFEIINGSKISISQLSTDDEISKFVEMWLKMGYDDLPEN